MSSPADRVRDLIHGSEMSQREFAAAIGLDDSKLSKSLSGTRRFSSVDLARIAELCKVTVDWLITGDEPTVAIAARHTGGNAGMALELATRLSRMRTDMAGLGFPQPWQASEAPSAGGRWVSQGNAMAEQAAERMRAVGRSVADPDLPGAAEQAFGADVAITDLDTDFDGMAASSNLVKLIVLGRTTVPGRQRFTLAHELGHLLAGDDQGVHLDRDIFDRSQQKEPSEQRANAFAAAFLMPESTLRAAVGSTGLTERAFAELVCDLIVSPAPLAYRLRQLRLVDSGTCDRFRTYTGARAAQLAGRAGWWAELVSRANTPRPPGLLVRDTYAAYELGSATLRPYANLLGVDVDSLRTALEAEAGVGSAS